MGEPRFSVAEAGVRPEADGAGLDDAQAVLAALHDVLGKTSDGAAAVLLLAMALLLHRSHRGDLGACHASADAMPRLLREMLARMPGMGTFP